MGGNPVETKVEVPSVTDVLAAAAGVPNPIPPKSGGLLAKAWHYRKLALILGGSGITLGGGSYGYKYFTASPAKANAQVAVVTPKQEEPNPLPGSIKEDRWSAMPEVTPVKSEAPVVPDIKGPGLTIPEVKMPVIKPAAPSTDVPSIVAPPPSPGTDTKKAAEPSTLVLPPVPGADTKKQIKAAEPAPDVGLPAIPIVLPPSDKKKAAPEGDAFKATDPLTKDKTKPRTTSPAPLPSDVTEKKEKPATGPVIRIGGIETMPPAAPIPDVPTIAPPAATPVKKAEPAAAPMIPKIDLELPPITPPDAKKEVTAPPVPPITVPGPNKNDPPVVVPGKDKLSEVPTINLPDVSLPHHPKGDSPKVPVNVPMGNLIPSVPLPDLTIPPVGVAPPAVKKDNYEEDWHTWKTGDTFTLISQEFLHDTKYAAALEAYNKDRGKGGDRIIRVPPPYVLEEQFPHLINKTEKTETPEVKTTSGLRFEPAEPIKPAGRSTPASRRSGRHATRPVSRDGRGGESIREVARKTLGDSNLWWKLGELNPSIDPSRPIPAGMAIKLPK